MPCLPLLMAVHNPCQRREMTVSTNNGLVNGEVHNLLMQFFTPGQGGGKNAIRIFSHFPHFFSHFLGRSLSVMFKRIHSSGIV